MWHPELKGKWTTGLEKCRTQALNPGAVASFFTILGEVLTKYNIPIENIYNMDKKASSLEWENIHLPWLTVISRWHTKWKMEIGS